MSEYHDSQLTAFGADLAQRASNGDTKFTITKATSTADDLSQTDLSQLITLPHEKQTGEIDRILPDPNGGTKVKGTKVSFDNLNLTESYPIQAMALYAKEDVDGAKEQLYAVTTAADPETMPKSDSAVMFTFSASIYVIVGNASQVTINVNPDSFATKEYVADAIANVKVDTSDLAKLSQDNYYTGDNQFKYDPVNKDGDAYGLAKNIDTKVTDNADGTITVNGKIYTPADDSKVVHDSGTEEIGGQKTFDTAPIDKTTGNPYITAKTPGIPKLAVTYNATSKAFDYTLTAPEKDGLSDIIQYNLLWKDHSVDDWTTVIVKPDTLTGQLTGVDITKTYDFKATAQNAVGSSDSTDVITVPTVDGNIYGVSWDGSSSGALQRTDAAAGLKAGINGTQNDFDTRGPWGLMDKTVTDSYGNAFVRVPKFYIRKTQDKSKPLSTWQVSLVKQGDDWYLPNCFYDFDDKKELDYVDVSRYEGSVISGKLQSKTGVTPTTNQTIVQLRSSAVANNTDGKKGYHLWDVHTLDALQVLFTIEFATLDSQSIMKGNTDNTGTSLINTGATDNVKGSSGFVTSGATPMTYRGIENLYGNLAMWTDGLNISNLSLYSCDDATKYVSDTFTDPYYKVSYPLVSSGGQNITGLGLDKDHPGVTAPTSFNSDSYNTYYHDEGYVYANGSYVVITGGSWGWGAGGSGLWCWAGDPSSTDARSAVGSRLLKKAL
ncbi:fibronectin type III domain-containing protein [Lentilactobacillus parabuchneri]|uniref:fibronectin type III domain-containing protein n=1 Tax=Lentilactobacillus parabuchneri TaxID=152331 RepID=UPI000A113DE2|nr:fibronectin type III domain-containing protein [Lentilactobacillus parabuchneri]ORN02680.1 hypothetical protein FAM21829_01814 [Lentilactobacillus parabuchneri]